MKNTATAVWKGGGKEGEGKLSTKSETLKNTSYSFKSRFETVDSDDHEDDHVTNPEELIAAAHAGCFTMKLAFNLEKADFKATSLKTVCEVTLKDGSIVSSNLNLKAVVSGISEDKFKELVTDAKENCPISKLLNTEMALDYDLES